MNIESFKRRTSCEVKIGEYTIGGDNPIAVQSMTNTDTKDVEASCEQILSIEQAGGEIVRLTAQGRREAESLELIMQRLQQAGSHAAIVADIHFTPEVAATAALYVDKVRINPGNYRLDGGHLERLIELCKSRGVALRIGVNHGSLSDRMLKEWGDTPEGMVAAAMEFLEICRHEEFDQVVVSMKSSNTRVMVQAYRMLAEEMDRRNMCYPIHLGVTEAGNGIEGRIKSSVGIGALLSDGIGDTIRVSLTEAPKNEIPVAKMLTNHFRSRNGEFKVNNPERYTPLKYHHRSSKQLPIIHSEYCGELLEEFTLIESTSENPTAELRAAILNLEEQSRPVIVKRHYAESNIEELAIKAAADLGLLFLDGLADGIWIDAPQHSEQEILDIELMILQASRVRSHRTEYIACPSCGRTLFDIESRLNEIKARTSHLSHLKIGVMGCIVNGLGEMADADYGYVGAAANHISLYKGQTLIERNIPECEALDKLIELIKSNGDWIEPAI